MNVPRQEISHEFVNERSRFIEKVHADEAMLSAKIVNQHAEIRALVPQTYLS